MTFREFVEQTLAEFEQQLRRQELEPSTIEIRLRGAREFALLVLGDPPPKKGDAKVRRFQGEETNRRFGGPRN